MLKDTLVFQATETVGAQVFHQNYDRLQLISKIESYMEASFRQMEATCTHMQATVLVSKKGKVTIKKKKIQTENKVDLSHNKVKKYILQEGTLVPFLVDLGVQTKEGRIVNAQYDKFRRGAGRTLRSVLIVLGTKLGRYDYKEIYVKLIYTLSKIFNNEQ